MRRSRVLNTVKTSKLNLRAFGTLAFLSFRRKTIFRTTARIINASAFKHHKKFKHRENIKTKSARSAHTPKNQGWPPALPSEALHRCAVLGGCAWPTALSWSLRSVDYCSTALSWSVDSCEYSSVVLSWLLHSSEYSFTVLCSPLHSSEYRFTVLSLFVFRELGIQVHSPLLASTQRELPLHGAH